MTHRGVLTETVILYVFVWSIPSSHLNVPIHLFNTSPNDNSKRPKRTSSSPLYCMPVFKSYLSRYASVALASCGLTCWALTPSVTSINADNYILEKDRENKWRRERNHTVLLKVQTIIRTRGTTPTQMIKDIKGLVDDTNEKDAGNARLTLYNLWQMPPLYGPDYLEDVLSNRLEHISDNSLVCIPLYK